MSDKKLQVIMLLCLKVDAYLKTMQKALTVDGEDSKDFENTYDELIDEIKKSNWQIHDLADNAVYPFRDKIKFESFHEKLLELDD